MTNEERKEIEDLFDSRYVLKDDCTERKETIDKRFANDDKRIEIIAHDFGVLKRLLWLVAGACVSEVVVLLFSLIIK